MWHRLLNCRSSWASCVNMERGVHLREIPGILRDCPDVQPFDVILANELDDGCARSGNKNTARELAEAFGLNYAWGLEFIELVNDENEKASTEMPYSPAGPSSGRALSVCRSSTIGTLTAKGASAGGWRYTHSWMSAARPLGVVSIHLENRTHGEGRRIQDGDDPEIGPKGAAGYAGDPGRRPEHQYF